jgi:SAM-dependent methyltransferase
VCSLSIGQRNMLAVAGPYLAMNVDRGPSAPATVAGPHLLLVRADASALPLERSVDAIFSTATLHWVLDHPRLFASIHAALKPGGRFVAQCGGGPNVERLRGRVPRIMQEESFSNARDRFQNPWNLPMLRQRRPGFATPALSRSNEHREHADRATRTPMPSASSSATSSAGRTLRRCRTMRNGRCSSSGSRRWPRPTILRSSWITGG